MIGFLEPQGIKKFEILIASLPHPKERFWEFKYKEALHILELAKKKLLEL
jgi:hypothetical protein